jgi:esterase
LPRKWPKALSPICIFRKRNNEPGRVARLPGRFSIVQAQNSLHYNQFGSGEPLVILHGLFGSSKNWQSLGRQFAEHFSVYTVDLRNHGSSFHDQEMNYAVMAEDLYQLLQQLDIQSCRIIGHSMGGKVAMLAALKYPDLFTKLVVADIAPVSYSHDHDSLLEPIMAVRLDEMASRADVDNALKPAIADPMLRGFLLQNLAKEETQWRWKVNWQAIDQQMSELTGFPQTEPSWSIDISTLFIRGGNSNYVGEAEIAVIGQHFDKATIETLAQAGHWLHAEQPKLFLEKVLQFLR